jgi:hypothetical protein
MEDQIKKLIYNIQQEFIISYPKLAKHLKKATICTKLIAEYAGLKYELLLMPDKAFSKRTKKQHLEALQKLDIDEIAHRLIRKESPKL